MSLKVLELKLQLLHVLVTNKLSIHKIIHVLTGKENVLIHQMNETDISILDLNMKFKLLAPIVGCWIAHIKFC